ncbi:glycosyltransferase family 4 protein [Planococcus beigongshangi]|uniref:glycosyltransferase family 4 protein n=1 Tax=Planococcus beigongshangi TaxID=2782536 RepID=UPI00193C4976|nr:glycosyltransferase family 4 protein [Planococcus beigongshangi]
MKILYVTTVSSTMVFFTSHIKMLLDQDHTVDIACNFDLPINEELVERGCKVFNMDFDRNPLSFKNYSGYKQLKKTIIHGEYDLVHTHTPIASVIVRIACKNLKNVKVYYTAHGFHFFKGAPLQNWLIYYPIEKWLSKYTDVLLTINKEDYTRAKKFFKAKRIEYIPGVGLDIKKYNNFEIEDLVKQRELGVPENAFVVLSVGELNKNKNHEVIIKALAKLKDPNIYYLICGQGPLKQYLETISIENGVKKQVIMLGYRKDIAEICKVADIFAFPSKREGLGLAALEAMASGLPIVTSNIHGIKDYSEDGKSGFSLDSGDVTGFSKKIMILKDNLQLRHSMGKYNMQVVKKYSIENTLEKLNEIYNNF